MRCVLKGLNRFIVASYDLIKSLAGIAMIAVILIVTVGIISRYFLSYALSWVEEVCCLLLIWLCYMSASLTTVKKEHVVADFLSSMLPELLKKGLKTIIRLGEIAFFAIVSYSVCRLIPRLTNVSAALQIPRFWYYLPVLIFGTYMAFAVLIDLLNDLMPGCDFFGQRQAKWAEEAAKQEQRENEEMLRRVEAFMDSSDREEGAK